MNAMPPKDDALSRRSFLDLLVKACLAGSALMGLGIVMRYLGYHTEDSRSSQYDLGLASEYPPGSRIPVQDAQAIIIHDNQGFHAISLVCPHLGCTVNVTSEGFSCPCHGSRFIPDGSLRKGPASHPLNSIPIEVDGEDHLILFPG
jgi:cytochrome b6-f complex iron-sulfur subunit